MKDFDFRSPKNIFYLSVIGISVIAMIVLFTGFLKDKSVSEDSSSVAATLAPKKEKVLVTTSTETIEDGLRDMGVLITQEYYFTQVEKYTKEKKILNVINSSSEFIYSYDGSVSAGIDFGGITLDKDDENKTITVNIPKSEIQTVNIDTNTFQVYSEKDSLCKRSVEIFKLHGIPEGDRICNFKREMITAGSIFLIPQKKFRLENPDKRFVSAFHTSEPGGSIHCCNRLFFLFGCKRGKKPDSPFHFFEHPVVFFFHFMIQSVSYTLFRKPSSPAEDRSMLFLFRVRISEDRKDGKSA